MGPHRILNWHRRAYAEGRFEWIPAPVLEKLKAQEAKREAKTEEALKELFENETVEDNV